MAITNWKFAVLLLSFQNSTATHRRPLQFYKDMFLNPGNFSLQEYWENISFTKINLAGSQVFDFKKSPLTIAQFNAQADLTSRTTQTHIRVVIGKMAMDLFPEVDFRTFNSVIIIPDENVKDASAAFVSGTFTLKVGTQTSTYTAGLPITLSNVDLLGNGAAHANFFAHEMGHNFGLPHSNGIESGLGNDTEGPLEYGDPWDILGGGNPFGPNHIKPMGVYTWHGVGMHAMNLNKLGWLPDARIKSILSVPTGRAAGAPDEIVILQPLTNMDTPLGFPAARVVFADADTGGAQAYWIELRMNTNWDSGATAPALLIRRVIEDITYIIPADRLSNRYGWQVGEVFIDERNNIRIGVDALTITGTNPQATIRVGSFVNLPTNLGTIGQEIQGAGIALTNVDTVNRPDLLLFGIENLVGENKGFTRIALNMSAEGVPAALGPERLIPTWGHAENQKGDISIMVVDNIVKPSAIVFALFVDNPASYNKAFFRVGTDLRTDGSTAWTDKVALPRKMANRNVGAAVALTHLEATNVKPDVVAAFADLPALGKPWLYYRVAKDMSNAGVVTAWSDPIDLPKFYGYNIAGIGIAIGDLQRTGKKDMVLFVMDRSAGVCKGHYCIGKDLGPTGIVRGGWTEWVSVPGTFATDTRDVSIELSTKFTDTANQTSMLIFSAEKASATAPCQGFLRLMKRVKV